MEERRALNKAYDIQSDLYSAWRSAPTSHSLEELLTLVRPRSATCPRDLTGKEAEIKGELAGDRLTTLQKATKEKRLPIIHRRRQFFTEVLEGLRKTDE